MTDPKYAAFTALDPFFDIVQQGKEKGSELTIDTEVCDVAVVGVICRKLRVGSGNIFYLP